MCSSDFKGIQGMLKKKNKKHKQETFSLLLTFLSQGLQVFLD